MAIAQNTIWERFLQPIFQLLVDEKPLKELYDTVDWQKEYKRLSNPNLVYPEYYISQNFHGIKGGYLTPDAAVTYDPVTQYVLPPNETWIRQELIAAIDGKPQNILDMGCGTGSTTIMLQQAFPDAKVTGLDLSPYMLAIAERKAKQANLKIQWLHSLAEETQLEPRQFDLITASLLFHETPPYIAQAILQECFRLLTPGGQILILDGNQKTIRQISWLTEVFEEPYIKDYAEESVDAWMGAVGFTRIRTDDIWGLNQVTRATK